MKNLCLLTLLSIAGICICSYPSFASADNDAQDQFLKNYSKFVAHSPDINEVKVDHHNYINKKVLFALVGTSSLLGIVLLLLSWFWIAKLRKLKKFDSESTQNLGVNFTDARNGSSLGSQLDKCNSKKGSAKKRFVPAVEYELLMAATNNFDDRNILGEGALGQVFKAHFSENFVAAVKRIYACGYESDKEFQNKVMSLSKIHHQNIVSLLAYCVYGEAWFLVYGLMPNGSLEHHLTGPNRRSRLNWQLRMRITLDVAKGLDYLHERCNPPVIHGNLKSSNILLDSNFRAKISDLGLVFSQENLKDTSVKLTGSLAYVAPEYLLDGELTDKSDVYAFGIILLELLLGRRPLERVDEAQYQSIVTWAMPQITDRSKLPNIVDPAIRDTMDLKHLYQVAAIAVLCVQPEPSYRPLITDVLYSLIPLVPVDLGGSLRVTDSPLSICRSDASMIC